MLVTSATTCGSFYANLLSIVSVVRGFGFFMGTLVLWNFVNVSWALVRSTNIGMVRLEKGLGIQSLSFCCQDFEPFGWDKVVALVFWPQVLTIFAASILVSEIYLAPLLPRCRRNNVGLEEVKPVAHCGGPWSPKDMMIKQF